MTSTTRELPADQNTISEDNEFNDTELQTMERAMNISKQFEEIKAQTVDDGTVLGIVKEIDTSPSNTRVFVNIDLPAESTPLKRRFKKPKVWSDKYAFVRWIREYGYDADSFPNMIDDECKVHVEEKSSGDGYDVIVPPQSTSVSELLNTVKQRYINIDEPVITATAIVTLIITSIGTAAGLLPSFFGFGQSLGIIAIALILIFIISFIEISFLNSKP